MARREFIEGTWSRQYEYVEICRDDYSCRKKFKLREEEDLADAYYNHLQSLDDQANTFREQKRAADEQKRAADEQKRAADELEALRKVTEEKSRRDREYFRNQFPQPAKQVLDPEFQEWLEFKKATDPEFVKWKKAKAERARKAEEERRHAMQEAEQKRIAAEQERRKKEAEERLRRAEEERKQKEAELRPYEEGVLGRKILPIEMRIKVARETSKEEVMMLCAKTSIASVVEALKQNPNLTPKVRETIQANIKAEQQRLAEEKAQKEAELLEKERIKTAIRWVVGLAIAAGLIFLIIRYWHTISVILIVIFVLFILIK